MGMSPFFAGLKPSADIATIVLSRRKHSSPEEGSNETAPCPALMHVTDSSSNATHQLNPSISAHTQMESSSPPPFPPGKLLRRRIGGFQNSRSSHELHQHRQGHDSESSSQSDPLDIPELKDMMGSSSRDAQNRADNRIGEHETAGTLAFLRDTTHGMLGNNRRQDREIHRLNLELGSYKRRLVHAEAQVEALRAENDGLRALLAAREAHDHNTTPASAVSPVIVHGDPAASRSPEARDSSETLDYSDLEVIEPEGISERHRPFPAHSPESIQLLPASKSIAAGIARAGRVMLGGGASGVVMVWQGKGKLKPKLRAVKMLTVREFTAENLADASAMEAWRGERMQNFKNEVRILKAFRKHAHIVNCHRLVQHEDGYNMAAMMDLMSGTAWDCMSNGRSISSREGLVLLKHIASALSALHAAGLVHLDVKPENIGFCKRRNQCHWKLMDFGLVTAMGAHINGHGTPYYRAPEVMEGECNEKNDSFSLGVTALHVCQIGGLAGFMSRLRDGDDPRGEKRHFERLQAVAFTDGQFRDWSDLVKTDVEGRAGMNLINERIKFIRTRLPKKFHVLGFDNEQQRAARNHALATALWNDHLKGKVGISRNALGPLAGEVNPIMKQLEAALKLAKELPCQEAAAPTRNTAKPSRPRRLCSAFASPFKRMAAFCKAGESLTKQKA